MEELLQYLAGQWQIITDNPLPALVIIGNLIIIESLLSVDNAAVLATMVMDLHPKQRSKALRYGIIGAYVFRGLCLLFAGLLVQIWWLKPLGGIYLLWLAVDQFKHRLRIGEYGSVAFRLITLLLFLVLVDADARVSIGGMSFNIFAWLVRPLILLAAAYYAFSFIKLSSDEEDDGEINKSNNAVYQFFYGKIGPFWATVILVEVMDLAFSIDNVFAAVAFTNNLILVWTGVFIGILAMRFVAQGFVKLMERYVFLETAAFIVIGILGLKLLLALYEHRNPEEPFSRFLGSHAADWAVSILTVSIFVVPILTARFLGWPAAAKKKKHSAFKNPDGRALDEGRPAVAEKKSQDQP